MNGGFGEDRAAGPLHFAAGNHRADPRARCAESAASTVVVDSIAASAAKARVFIMSPFRSTNIPVRRDFIQVSSHFGSSAPSLGVGLAHRGGVFDIRNTGFRNFIGP